MEKKIELIKELISYSRSISLKSLVTIQEEENHLMRFANSGISLNTSERLLNISIMGYDGKKKAMTGLVTDANELEKVKRAMDELKKTLEVSQELSYTPTIPAYDKDYINEDSYDERLRNISNEEKLEFFNIASKGLETDDIKLSGSFLSGFSRSYIMSTESDHININSESDAQLLVVLSSEKYKWEVNSETSAQNVSELDPYRMHEELKFLVDVYTKNEGVEVPPGDYDIIMGRAATAEILNHMSFQIQGGMVKRGYGFIKEDFVGEKVFSEKFTLRENPNNIGTFPQKTDIFGVTRGITNIFENGVFKGFLWDQESADEFSVKSTGHTVTRLSLELMGKDKDITSIKELAKLPKDKDILYIPYIHYMNIVNPSEGLLTGSSRFGALLLKKDGSILPIFNVRMTRSYKDFFGENLEWLSKETEPYNITTTYGSRNPMAIVVPKFIKVNNITISQSNKSY